MEATEEENPNPSSRFRKKKGQRGFLSFQNRIMATSKIENRKRKERGEGESSGLTREKIRARRREIFR